MSKKRRQQTEQSHVEIVEPKKLKPLTKNQNNYFKAIDNSVITIVTGPAGTGKTYMAAGKAAEALKDGEFEKIVLVRPMVVCGSKDIGALPGGMDEKIGPYMRPLIEAFEDFFKPQELQMLIRNKRIELQPLELMRGSTLKKAFVILDEAQNCEFAQIHMFLTRIGKESKYVITGDVKQNDRKAFGPNPLGEVVRRFSTSCHRDISIVELDRTDIVRHPLIGWMDARLSDENYTSKKEEPAAKQEKPEWLGDECPACETEFWYPESDEKGRPIEQVVCWRCRNTIEIPEDENEDCYLADCVTQGCIESHKEIPEGK